MRGISSVFIKSSCSKAEIHPPGRPFWLLEGRWLSFIISGFSLLYIEPSWYTNNKSFSGEAEHGWFHRFMGFYHYLLRGHLPCSLHLLPCLSMQPGPCCSIQRSQVAPTCSSFPLLKPFKSPMESFLSGPGSNLSCISSQMGQVNKTGKFLQLSHCLEILCCLLLILPLDASTILPRHSPTLEIPREWNFCLSLEAKAFCEVGTRRSDTFAVFSPIQEF